MTAPFLELMGAEDPQDRIPIKDYCFLSQQPVILYNLAYYLHTIIKKSVPAATSYISNSHLVDQINDMDRSKPETCIIRCGVIVY